MKTLYDLALLVQARERELAFGSETCLLGAFVSEFDTVGGILSGETDLDISVDVTDTYTAYDNAYQLVQKLESERIEYVAEDLF